MKVYLTALGCKLNQAEIEALAREVKARGHAVVTDVEAADWAIVNTCTVTHVAARKSRQLIRQLYKSNPRLSLAITGCYADISPDVVGALNGVCLVASNMEKDGVIDRILPPVRSDDAQPQAEPAPLESGRTRAFVKIQDGCDNHCTYCIVTIARGPQRSRAPERVLAEIEARLSEGYREIVLTGVNIGAYGRDSAADEPPCPPGWSLPRLVRAILDGTSVPRIRLSSIEPWDISPELLSLWKDARLCRHVHLPLQSGCDATLRRMARKNSTADFAEMVALIRESIPDVSITTDLIVGFPGETEPEFAETLAFVERMAFARLHVFKYSRRPGTVADRLPNQVSPAVAQTRSAALIALGHRLARAFHARFEGRDMLVLFERATEQGSESVWNGLTDNYIRVSARAQGDLHNRLVCVHCTAADDAGLQGQISEAPCLIDRKSSVC